MGTQESSDTSEAKGKKGVTFSRQQIIGWGLVFFAVSGLMFTMGVLVGRGTAPIAFDINQLEKDLEDLQKTFASNTPDEKGAKLSDKPDLEFYDKLKEGKEDDSQLNVKTISKSRIPNSKDEMPLVSTSPGDEADAPGETDAEAPEEEDAPSETLAESTKSPKTVEALQENAIVKRGEEENSTTTEPLKPIPDASKDRLAAAEITKPSVVSPPPKLPEATISSPGTGRYTIQVASFKNIEDADKLVKTLGVKGFSAYRTIGKTIESGIWYRVRIGSYTSREDAQKTLHALTAKQIQGIVIDK